MMCYNDEWDLKVKLKLFEVIAHSCGTTDTPVMHVTLVNSKVVCRKHNRLKIKII